VTLVSYFGKGEFFKNNDSAVAEKRKPGTRHGELVSKKRSYAQFIWSWGM